MKETIGELLHDAEHADSGLLLAQTMGDTASATHLRAKRDRLLREALALDPLMKDADWDEETPEMRKLATALASVGTPKCD